jgi:hypothetical protein
MKARQVVVASALVLMCRCGLVQAESVRLADGTAVHVRLKADLLSAQAAQGNRVDFEVVKPVTQDGTVVIPEGSVAWGAVQLAKAGKALRFDIEGLWLPSLKDVKLRCSPQKTANVGKDEIKVESHVGSDLGVPKGSEFVAYLDQEVTVEVAGAPAATVALAPTVSVAPTEPAAPAHPVVTRAAEPAAAAQPAVSPAPVVQPQTSAASAAPASPVPASQPEEYVTVECFSDPLGADILIDGEFHGNTPSIMKILSGRHEIEYQLIGYKAHTETLTLTPGSGIRTLRVTLEKKE